MIRLTPTLLFCFALLCAPLAGQAPAKITDANGKASLFPFFASTESLTFFTAVNNGDRDEVWKVEKGQSGSRQALHP